MRSLYASTLMLLAVVTPAAAQRPSSDTTHAALTARIARELAALDLTDTSGRVPPADSFTTGNRLVPAGATIHGSVGVTDGRLEVSGEVDGSAIALGGDVVVHRGGIVTGDAMAFGGRVIVDGGRVDGEMRSVSTVAHGTRPHLAASAEPWTSWQAVKLVLGCFAVLVIIGLGVLVFAERNLDGVVGALERAPVRAFWLGLLGELALLPVLTLVSLALVLTLIGTLLVPFTIVAFVLAAAGLVTLGFLAVSRLTGSAVVARRESGRSTRGEHLSALFVGLVIYGALWLVAALLVRVPIAGDVVRGLALAVTWVAATAGFGGALASRAGTSEMLPRKRARRTLPDELSWQTPTPITGVAAARRPVPTRSPQP